MHKIPYKKKQEKRGPAENKKRPTAQQKTKPKRLNRSPKLKLKLKTD